MRIRTLVAILPAFLIPSGTISGGDGSNLAVADLNATLSRAVSIEWDSFDGYLYQLQRSEDLECWESERNIEGNGTRMREFITANPRDFFRIVLLLEGNYASIPGGTFTMGSPPNEPGHDDEEQHEVTLSPFNMKATEVPAIPWRADQCCNHPGEEQETDQRSPLIYRRSHDRWDVIC